MCCDGKEIQKEWPKQLIHFIPTGKHGMREPKMWSDHPGIRRNLEEGY
jgi:hypothetical protein